MLCLHIKCTRYMFIYVERKRTCEWFADCGCIYRFMCVCVHLYRERLAASDATGWLNLGQGETPFFFSLLSPCQTLQKMVLEGWCAKYPHQYPELTGLSLLAHHQLMRLYFPFFFYHNLAVLLNHNWISIIWLIFFLKRYNNQIFYRRVIWL